MNYSSDNPSSEPTYTQLELPFDNLEPLEAAKPAEPQYTQLELPFDKLPADEEVLFDPFDQEEDPETSVPQYTQLELPFGDVDPRLKYRPYIETTCWDSGEQIALDIDYIGSPLDDEISAQKVLAQFMSTIPNISAYAGMTSTVIENLPSKFMVIVQDDSALILIKLCGGIEWVLPNE
jgi:hypothetical protein